MVIAPATRKALVQERKRHEQPRAALLGALRRVHAEQGELSFEALDEIAEIFALHPVEVLEVARSHPLFDALPEAAHRVRVCTSLPCALRGAGELLAGLSAHLGLDASSARQTGPSQQAGRGVVLDASACIGACDAAPLLQIDGETHGGVDLDEVKRLVDALVTA